MQNTIIKQVVMLFAASLLFISSYAQETGFLIFSGETKFSNSVKKKIETYPETKIAIIKTGTNDIIKELTSDKKGKFEFNLPFGTDYTITFSRNGAIPAFIIVYASQVPDNMYEIFPPRYQTDVVMMGEKDKGTDKYKCPFAKVVFNKKEKGFMEDRDHRSQFENGTIACAERFAKTPPVAKPVVALPAVAEEKKMAIGGKFLAGENPSTPLVNTTVSLVNNNNQVVETTTTNLLGSFVFTEFAYEKNNLLRVTASDVKVSAGKKIMFIGKDGKEIQTTTANDKGAFEFKVLAADKNSLTLMEIEDTELKRDLIGKLLSEGNPVGNSKLNLKNNEGVLIQSTVTDATGKFIFTDVANKQVVVIAIDPGANIQPGAKVVIADENGKAIKELTYKPNEIFEYKMLPAEQKELSRYYADDPWLKVVNLKAGSQLNDDIVITESVYFNAADATILPEAQKVLDKVVSIMQQVPEIKMEVSSHTDSRGSDESNMVLSKKRAEAAVAYLVSKKIDPKRLKPVGYGETKLLNRCKNEVECTEEEHAKNRRVEFKVVR